MSWDIELRCDHCGNPIIKENYTSNVNDMIREAAKTGGVSIIWSSGFVNLSGIEGKIYLRIVITEMELNPKKYKAMEPENGWGDLETLLPVLRRLRDAVPETVSTWYVFG